jgi:hypothetical protein
METCKEMRDISEAKFGSHHERGEGERRGWWHTVF